MPSTNIILSMRRRRTCTWAAVERCALEQGCHKAVQGCVVAFFATGQASLASGHVTLLLSLLSHLLVGAFFRNARPPVGARPLLPAALERLHRAALNVIFHPLRGASPTHT